MNQDRPPQTRNGFLNSKAVKANRTREGMIWQTIGKRIKVVSRASRPQAVKTKNREPLAKASKVASREENKAVNRVAADKAGSKAIVS